MDYNKFSEWLKTENIELSFDTIGNSGVNGRMNFVKDGEWFLSTCRNENTDYFEVKEAILAELEGVNAQSIEDVVTVTEVAELLEKDTSTIRKAVDKAIADGILINGKDCRKARQIWLLRKVAIKKMGYDISWKQIETIKNPDRSGIL